MIIETIVLIIYTIALALILVYALMQLNLLFNYLKAQKTSDTCVTYNLNNPDEIPYVTIQFE
jgi:hypothetical protein